MTVWLPITVLVWASSLQSRMNLFVWFFLFSTLTGASIASIGEKGIQPLYFMMYGMMYIFILNYFVKQPRIFKLPYSLMVLLLFAVFVSMNSLFSAPVNIAQSVYVLSIPVVVFISYLITEEMTYERILDHIFKVSIVIFIYGLLDVSLKYFQLPSLENFFVNNMSVMDNTWATAYGVPRATSVFPEPSYLGAFSAVILLFCLSLFASRGKIKIKLLTVTTLLSAINLFLTASLTGYAAFAAGIIYLIMMTFLSGSFLKISMLLKNVIIFIILALLIYLAIYLLFPSFIDELSLWTLVRFQFSDDSTMMRTGGLMGGYDLMMSYPVTGIGIGNYTSSDLMSTVAATSGVIGFLLLSLWFLFPILKSLLYSISKKLNNRNLPFFMIFFTIFVLFSTGLGHTIILWPWVLLGMSINFIHSDMKRSISADTL